MTTGQVVADNKLSHAHEQAKSDICPCGEVLLQCYECLTPMKVCQREGCKTAHAHGFETIDEMGECVICVPCDEKLQEEQHGSEKQWQYD